MKIKNTTLRALATIFTLSASLIGGANAATLVTWSIINPTTATATLHDGTTVSATAFDGASFSGLHEIGDSAWNADFGNSFFPTVDAGNGLDLTNAPGGTIVFNFFPNINSPELWYSNAIADFTFDETISSIILNEANQTSSFGINNFGTELGDIGDPVQSAGRVTIDGDTGDFAIQISTGGPNELIRFSIVDSTVPEPSSTALLGLGGLALILRRRR